MGTRGSAEERAREANEAARILKAGWRQALDISDGRVENTYDNRLKVARVIRRLRPRVLVLPYWQARHPDHATASLLGYEAAFLACLTKLDLGAPPHRPFKIIYASLYADVRPTFVVDISAQFEARFAALMAYRSQYQIQDLSSGTTLRGFRGFLIFGRLPPSGVSAVHIHGHLLYLFMDNRGPDIHRSLPFLLHVFRLVGEDGCEHFLDPVPGLRWTWWRYPSAS